MLKTYRIPIITLFLVLFVDQFIKIFIKLNYPLGEVGRLGNWCIIHFTENPGMAFGMEFGGDYGKLILSVFRILASIGGIIYIRHIVRQKENPLFIFCVSLILAGAIGNILDSVFYGSVFTESDEFLAAQLVAPGNGYSGFLYGHVVDMFYFPLFNGRFPEWFPIWGGEEFQFFRPIFNFADFAISVGVGLLIVFQKRIQKKPIETLENEEPIIEETKPAEQ
ncbi:MAG: lipoprotein signal peptidase [Sphingobacteriaceae bacterium]|nr:lipoprotein signal peptidase [Sphingobacteriaceae bacterium]